MSHAEKRRAAAAWFALLSRPAVTTEALREFWSWKRDPQHRAAYNEVEELWRHAGDLAADAQIEALCRRAMAGGIRRSASRVHQRAAAVTVALGVAASIVVTVMAVVGASPAVYATGVGEQRRVHLADGSVLRLDTDSRAVVAFSRRRRNLLLTRGQALLQVAHDPQRPFLVRADGTVVRALGTVFDVRLSGRDLGVVLLQGSVLVKTSKGDQVMLHPGQAVHARAGVLATPNSVDPGRAVSWTQRRLIFAGAPLAAAVAEVNRYTRAKVALEAPDVAAVPVSASSIPAMLAPSPLRSRSSSTSRRRPVAAVKSFFGGGTVERGDGRVAQQVRAGAGRPCRPASGPAPRPRPGYGETVRACRIARRGPRPG